MDAAEAALAGGRPRRTSCACSRVSITPSSTTPAANYDADAAAEAYKAMLDWFERHLAPLVGRIDDRAGFVRTR